MHFTSISATCFLAKVNRKWWLRATAACMLTYADVCSRMLTYAHVCSRMLTYAHVGESEVVVAGDSRMRAFFWHLVAHTTGTPVAAHLNPTLWHIFTASSPTKKWQANTSSRKKKKTARESAQVRGERLREKEEEEEREEEEEEEEALREVGWCWEGRPRRCAAAQLYVPFFFSLSPIFFSDVMSRGATPLSCTRPPPPLLIYSQAR
jgi:hypothetical protein